MNPCEATEIHGPHGVHGFYLKILLKIFVKMSSISDAIPQNRPQKQRTVAYFQLRFLLKIIFPSNIRLNSDDK